MAGQKTNSGQVSRTPSINAVFGSQGAKDLSDSADDIKISWKHGGYKIYYNIKRFFISPRPRKELNLLEQVETLINSTPAEQEPTEELIEKCHHFIKLHRIIENTSARKRLEKWAKRVIVFYLLIVLVLVVFDSLVRYAWFEISDTVMITILSTTTVNIIGLGLIVLRGHFPQKDKESDINSDLKKGSK